MGFAVARGRVTALSDGVDSVGAEPIPFPGSRVRAPASRVDPMGLEPVMAAIAGGDHGALDRLYRLTSARLMAIAHHFMGNAHDAEDVLHDVYLTVWKKAGVYEAGRARPMAWLTAITRNRCLDRLRSRRRRGDMAPEVMEAIPDETADVVGAIEREQDGRRLLACMEQLDGEQREAVRSAFYGGQTYAALASALNIPLPTMKSRIRRALMLMRQCLQP